MGDVAGDLTGPAGHLFLACKEKCAMEFMSIENEPVIFARTLVTVSPAKNLMDQCHYLSVSFRSETFAAVKTATHR